MQATATLQATLSETEDPVPDHLPAVLNLLNNIKTDEVLPRVVFPGTNDEKQLLSMCLHLKHAFDASNDSDELIHALLSLHEALLPPSMSPSPGLLQPPTPAFLRTPTNMGIETNLPPKLAIINDARQRLERARPAWYIDKLSHFMVIPLSSWSSVVQSSPSNNKDSNMAMTIGCPVAKHVSCR